MNERELVIKLKEKKREVEALDENLKAAKKEYDELEMQLIEHLTETGAEATASYDGVGYAKMMKPRVYANCKVEHKDKLKEFLRAEGRGDMIKEDVPAPSLSSFVAERLESGKSVPEYLGYFLKTSVRFF